MKKLFVLFLFCFGVLFSRGEGISFFQGDFKAALAKAKTEKKMVFVDFMATWCGPCNMLSENTFPDKAVGDFFNQHFICVKVDVDKEKELTEQYGVEAMPTLVFMDAEGKELNRLQGYMEAGRLLRKARELTGDALTVDALWEQYQKNDQNLELMQELLSILPAETWRRKDAAWMARTMEMYRKYMELKPEIELINKPDFNIILLYTSLGQDDKMIQFVNKHLAEYVQVMPFGEVYDAIVPYIGGMIDELAKNGNPAYKKIIDQAVTDQAVVFDSLKCGEWSVKEFLINRAEGYDKLYAKKDQKGFIELRKEYFAKMHNQVTLENYQDIISDLFTATEENLTRESALQCVEWLQNCLVLAGEDSDLKMSILVPIGDCYVMAKDGVKAKECYEKAASLLSSPEEKEEFMQYVQQKLDSLK